MQNMKTILVVEDDTALSWLLEKILVSKYRVVRASDGLKAWAWLAEGHGCDLVISDVNLPFISGRELLENLKASSLYEQIPMLMLSALPDEDEICMELGASEYVTKPFNPYRLLQLVIRALNAA